MEVPSTVSAPLQHDQVAPPPTPTTHNAASSTHPHPPPTQPPRPRAPQPSSALPVGHPHAALRRHQRRPGQLQAAAVGVVAAEHGQLVRGERRYGGAVGAQPGRLNQSCARGARRGGVGWGGVNGVWGLGGGEHSAGCLRGQTTRRGGSHDATSNDATSNDATKDGSSSSNRVHAPVYLSASTRLSKARIVSQGSPSGPGARRL